MYVCMYVRTYVCVCISSVKVEDVFISSVTVEDVFISSATVDKQRNGRGFVHNRRNSRRNFISSFAWFLIFLLLE